MRGQKVKSNIIWHSVSALIAIGSATAAYFSYVAAQEQREVAREAQEALQASIKDGEIDPISINIAITNLSEVTGIQAVTLPEPATVQTSTQNVEEPAIVSGSDTGIRTSAGPLEVRLRNIRSRFGERRITLTTDFVNTSGEAIYLGALRPSRDGFASIDTGQSLTLTNLEGVDRFDTDPEQNTLLMPQEPVTIEWIVYADSSTIERGQLTVRQNFMVMSSNGEARQVTVQLRDIPLVQSSN